jgi:hypothetical protein
VYSERFQPHLEPAVREMDGPAHCAELEFEFGRLLVALEGRDGARVTAGIEGLEQRLRTVGDAAARAFPPPGIGPVESPKPGEQVRPTVPDVPPNWENGTNDEVSSEGADKPE